MNSTIKTNKLNTIMSSAELAELGAENVAYIRPISSSEVIEKFPVIEGLQPGQMLWALFAANGDPLALSDQQGGVLSNAHELDLNPVSLH